ncbi:hypothetical protein AB0368_11905 [Actinoplanes sp. NPDC051475]|uniref:hypothetical protein n=1 Tax=Actinoplanes sp. NPDC051475 TaxID=3157225 RepID=UPI00344FC638
MDRRTVPAGERPRTVTPDHERRRRGPASPRDPVRPRGLVSRSLIAATVFAAAVVPGWTLGDAAERWTGWGLLDWLVTGAVSAVAVVLLAPYGSYRRRDAVLGLVPIYGWYLTAVLSWRVALLPLRDWEPRGDELWRARWLTGDLIGFWRADPLPPPLPRRPGRGPRVRAGSAPRAGRPTS